MGRRGRLVVAGLLGTGLAASTAIGAGVPTPTQDGAGETARTSCAVEISSGTTSLDEATCRIAMAHAAFNPAMSADGKAVDGVYRLPVRWVLPATRLNVVDVSKQGPEDTILEEEVKIDADGRAISCTPTAVRLVTPILTPCAQFLPGSRTLLRWKRHGHLVGARLISRTTVHVVPDP